MKAERLERMTMRAITCAIAFMVATTVLPATETEPPEILMPDFQQWDISYSHAWSLYSWDTATYGGELLEVIGIPTVRADGPSTFDDGTVAVQTYTFTFLGSWHLFGNGNFGGEITVGEAFHIGEASIRLGVTEDTGDGSHWRIMTGGFPGAFVDHPAAPESFYVTSQSFRLCGQNNDLEYDYTYGDYYLNQRWYQKLAKSQCVSGYPAFSFIGYHGDSEYSGSFDDTWWHQSRYSIVMRSGENQDSNQE